MFKKLCIIVANSSASLIAKSSALLVADYSAAVKKLNFLCNQFTTAEA
jgi:hypothetical protein